MREGALRLQPVDSELLRASDLHCFLCAPAVPLPVRDSFELRWVLSTAPTSTDPGERLAGAG